jgi:hypothetical protein
LILTVFPHHDLNVFVTFCAEMFALLLDANSYVNTINTWAEPHNANGVTPNSIIDSNDEPPCNNQQRMIQRGY